MIILLLLLCFQDEIQQTELEEFPVADRFSEAIQKYNSVERSESETMFEKIILELETKATLDEDEHLIMTESLMYMGALNYPDLTESFFEKLIRFDPAHELKTRDLPPKIVAVFDKLKDQLVGTVRVLVSEIGSTRPLEDAEFVVDGRVMGTVYGEKVFHIFAGTREVLVRCPNFDNHPEELAVVAGQEAVVQASLTRIASQATVVTYPENCEVRLNGELLGSTDQQAPQLYRSKLGALGKSLTDVGSLTINDLPAGNYELVISKPCFRTSKYAVVVEEPKRINLEPAMLEPAQAFINVRAAADNSGLVFLNTERVGFLPVTNHKVCPGEYELRVTFTDGEYIKNITLDDGMDKEFLAEPLPSIVWFGLEDEKDGRPPGDMNDWINNLNQWNVRQVNPYDTSRVPVNPFPLLFGPEEIDEETSEMLTRQVQGDLYMAARVVRKKVVIRNVEVVFWAPLSKKVAVRSFDFREFDKFRALLDRLDAMPGLTRPWLGLQVGRLRGLPGVSILEVHPGGPLSGQVQVGEVITTLNGNLVRGPRDLVSVRSSDEVTLEVSGRLLKVKPQETIAEVPFVEEGAPQAMLARFEKLAKYHPDELIRKSALFNQARFQLFLGDYKQAFDIFSSLQLGDGYGINQGTLLFYQGLCFRRLKLASEANAGFASVLEYTGATLFDAYGPKAAFWAEAEMNNPNL